MVTTALDWGWTAYDVYNSASVALDANNSSEVRSEAVASAAAAIGMEILEPDEGLPISLPVDDIVRHSDEVGEFIYKSSSGSTKTLTPRPGIYDLDLETGGLSFFNDPAKMGLGAGDKYVVVDPKKLDGLKVVLDNVPPGHVSVKPFALDESKEWALSRTSDFTHHFTDTIKNAIVDIRKWK